MINKRSLYILLVLVSSALIAIINWHRGIDIVGIILIWSISSWVLGFMLGREDSK